MPKPFTKCTRRQKKYTRRSKHRKQTKRQRGGRLGKVPVGAIVSVQADAYSPRILVDDETAEQMFESRNTYRL